MAPLMVRHTKTSCYDINSLAFTASCANLVVPYKPMAPVWRSLAAFCCAACASVPARCRSWSCYATTGQAASPPGWPGWFFYRWSSGFPRHPRRLRSDQPLADNNNAHSTLSIRHKEQFIPTHLRGASHLFHDLLYEILIVGTCLKTAFNPIKSKLD